MRYLKPFGVILPFFMGAVFSACQPTPSGEIVVNKLNTEYAVRSEFQKMELPERLVLPVENMGKAFVSFDAEVVPSVATGYPVVHVKQGAFHMEQIQTMLDALLPAGVKTYEPWERTKEDYLRLMAETNQLDAENEDVRRYLDWLTEASESAALLVQKEPAKISDAPSGTCSSYYMEEAADGSVVSAVSFVRDGLSFGYFRDKEYLYTPFSGIEDGMPYEKPEPRPSQAEAEEVARQALKALGVDFPVAVAQAEPVVIHRLPKTEWCGWIFHFTRAYSGIPTIFDETGALDWRSPPSIGAPWGREMMRIVVDERGVFCFYWENPLKSAVFAAENIEMISLEEAARRAQHQFLYRFAAASEEAASIEQINVSVEKVELMMGVLSVQNQRELGQAVPIWKFYYTVDTGTPESKSKAYYLCISAIDGSYIDPIVTTQEIEDAQARK